MRKYFIITVDTEGDNLWEYQTGDKITTKNAKYIPSFQRLCDQYGFKPVYLVNYEMLSSNIFVDNAKKWVKENKCEIGIHPHAWNNPPEYRLDAVYNGQQYLIEYPEIIMRQKFQVLYDLIKAKFNVAPISHRAGRWAMNDIYFNILYDFGIKVDCSVTPMISWEKSKGLTCGGSNYIHANTRPHKINNILEVPMTIRKSHFAKNGTAKHKIKTLVLGSTIWLRPATNSLADMIGLIEKVDNEPENTYLEFMIHSSELMPGGSPYFRTAKEIDNLYYTMKYIFDFVSSKGYQGSTLKEYFKYCRI